MQSYASNLCKNLSAINSIVFPTSIIAFDFRTDGRLEERKISQNHKSDQTDKRGKIKQNQQIGCVVWHTELK